MYDRGTIMEDDERLQILKYIYTDKVLLNKLPFFRADYRLELTDKTVPIAIWKIKQRILEREDLKEYRSDPNFGDLITIIFPGGEIHKHRDPNGGDFSVHIRFNVFLQIPKEYDTFYGGNLVEAKERHYVLCRSGIDQHWTSTNNNSEPRIALSFGFMVPPSKLLKLYRLPEKFKHLETNFILSYLKATIINNAVSIIFLQTPPSLQHDLPREKGTRSELMTMCMDRLMSTKSPGSYR
jgi:hypothetical protein